MIFSFENGERLTGIAFQDLNFFVTSVRALKNFLLVGDIHRSVMLIGFQEEDPTRLVPLGKDYHSFNITDADFMLDHGSMSTIAADDYGNVQVLNYNPLRSFYFSNFEQCIIEHHRYRLVCW